MMTAKLRLERSYPNQDLGRELERVSRSYASSLRRWFGNLPCLWFDRFRFDGDMLEVERMYTPARQAFPEEDVVGMCHISVPIPVFLHFIAAV